MCAADPRKSGPSPAHGDALAADADAPGGESLLVPVAVIHQARGAVNALEDLARIAWAETGRSGSPPAEAQFVLRWSAGDSPEILAEQAFSRALELASDDVLFRLGHVYCYSCRSSECVHSSPPECGSVFAGYESTGRPRWQEFFNYLLELEDNRADLLFAEKPQIFARLVGRQRLVTQQLASFGKNSLTYRIWGQVVAGYLHIRGLRAALTVQLVEDRNRQLRLQAIADTETRDVLANAPDSNRSAFHRVYDALTEARHQVASLSALWQGARTREVKAEIRDKAFSALRHLVHSIERKGRQHRRRTAHAELRGSQQRPVHKAYDDIAAASRDAFFIDSARHSIIVVGKAGRVHAFNPNGRHITSFVLQGDELQRRTARGRYTAYLPDEVETFRQQALAAIPPAES